MLSCSHRKFWSALVGNDLRILIDASVERMTAEELMKNASLKVVCVCDVPALKDKADSVVMEFAVANRRIVVTTDKGFNEKAFKICEH